jgi:UDP-galactopyranose mutase
MLKLLIVGAGFSGAVIARELANSGFHCTVIDSRDHIAGNAYDYIDKETGIRIHRYGPHLFHTNNIRVVNWLSDYTHWVPYKHKVKARLKDGQYVTLPVNKETKEIVGEENIIDVFYRPYTFKMWNKTIEELNPKIIKRVPIRDDDNEYYFPDDKYQLLPKHGYTKMFENILDHANINVKLNTKFNKSMENDYDYIFNSMPIDEYFDYSLGELPYRSIKFYHHTLPFNIIGYEKNNFLPVTTVNFTDTGSFTRMTEWSHLPNSKCNKNNTIITLEEPCDYKDNNYERYYPVRDVDNNNVDKYKQYSSMVDKSKMQFIGRCGLYTYIDMDMAVQSALNTSTNFIKLHVYKL